MRRRHLRPFGRCGWFARSSSAGRRRLRCFLRTACLSVDPCKPLLLGIFPFLLFLGRLQGGGNASLFGAFIVGLEFCVPILLCFFPLGTLDCGFLSRGNSLSLGALDCGFLGGSNTLPLGNFLLFACFFNPILLCLVVRPAY